MMADGRFFPHPSQKRVYNVLYISEEINMAKKEEIMEDEIREEDEILDIDENGEDDAEPKKRNKKKQVRYIFMAEDGGWYEKERDNVRITKYYDTQKEAIDAARQHIKNSGMAGSIVVQSRKGKIRANEKVAKKK